MTTRRIDLTIEERIGCGPQGAAAGPDDPRPPAVSPEPEDPREPAVAPEPEDPREPAVSPEPEDPFGGGRGGRRPTLRATGSMTPAAGDYSGFIVVRVSDRCLGCGDGGGGKGAPAGEREYDRSGDPVCRAVRERIEHEAELLECLEPKVTVGRPLCLRALAELVRERPPAPLVRSVTPDGLRELERRAARTRLPPLHSLAAYCRIDACHLPLRVARELVALLGEMPWVDLAYLELAATDPEAGPAPGFFDFAAQQFYLDDAPVGLGARRLRAAGLPGGDGAGVRVIDLEQGWFLRHEDFAAPVPEPFYGANRPDGDPAYRGDHGTAVLGELGAVAGDDRGVDGFVPGAELHVVSHYDAETRSNGHVADAVVATLAVLAGLPLARGGPAPGSRFRPGDVLLLEVQRGRLPTEVDHADFDAVRLATALGLVVVEAAGNGGFDLDRYRDETGRRILARSAAGFRESGAVMVGAGRSELPHDRARFSCFGSRVDCYAWGDGVVTTGYGDLSGDGEERDAYTATFSGTSSASPMVAGVAAAVQALAEARGPEDRLTPRELRRALADPATGTPQGGGRPGAIGVMPDLPALVRRLGLVPDVVADVVLPDVVPATSGGGAPALAVSADGVSVRLVNRGLGTARGSRATFYAAELAPLVPPGAWRRLGTTAPVEVPQGVRAVQAGPVPLPADAPDPASILCVVHPEPEPPPLPPGAPYFRFDDFLAFLRRNVRSGRVESAVPPDGRPAELRFLLGGTPDRPRRFGFRIEQALPKGARASLLVPRALAGALAAGGLRSAGEERRALTVDGAARQVPLVRFRLAGRPRLELPSLRLGATAYPCRWIIEGLDRLDQGAAAELTLRQIHRGEEVGRVTWRIG